MELNINFIWPQLQVSCELELLSVNLSATWNGKDTPISFHFKKLALIIFLTSGHWFYMNCFRQIPAISLASLCNANDARYFTVFSVSCPLSFEYSLVYGRRQSLIDAAERNTANCLFKAQEEESYF